MGLISIGGVLIYPRYNSKFNLYYNPDFNNPEIINIMNNITHGRYIPTPFMSNGLIATSYAYLNRKTNTKHHYRK
jgi:hypothetical protein